MPLLEPLALRCATPDRPPPAPRRSPAPPASTSSCRTSCSTRAVNSSTGMKRAMSMARNIWLTRTVFPRKRMPPTSLAMAPPLSTEHRISTIMANPLPLYPPSGISMPLYAPPGVGSRHALGVERPPRRNLRLAVHERLEHLARRHGSGRHIQQPRPRHRHADRIRPEPPFAPLPWRHDRRRVAHHDADLSRRPASSAPTRPRPRNGWIRAPPPSPAPAGRGDPHRVPAARLRHPLAERVLPVEQQARARSPRPPARRPGRPSRRPATGPYKKEAAGCRASPLRAGWRRPGSGAPARPCARARPRPAESLRRIASGWMRRMRGMKFQGSAGRRPRSTSPAPAAAERAGFARAVPQRGPTAGIARDPPRPPGPHGAVRRDPARDCPRGCARPGTFCQRLVSTLPKLGFFC